ncbi:hypothetical protein BTO04_00660 [Polaribacter sp. SA4-10]|uniref:hypothetical protein n=1 Tax=Polaribacter sp. SA4-10 TaxID=754397 RepID=UPI000B3CE9C9|nr:hypothetical protein [Polaribacter sp. SA4-10]ARV05292.1 hypothetical protein BTO04_00660 [Polaribacter sp. SA4-10]
MNNTYIPNTNVKAKVLDPNPMNRYVSLFLKNNETDNGKNSGSVNAGTSNTGYLFSVGLGGINRAFKKSLKNAGQNTNTYQKIHQSLYDELSGSNLSAYNSKFSSADPVQFSIIRKPDPKIKLQGDDGIVFIDIFNPKEFPNGNPLNYSMIYVVPPNRENYTDNKTFLNAVEASCVNMIEALHLYNSEHAKPGNSSGLETIENIRMCLFSGGLYRGNTPQNDVARHNLLGIEGGLSNIGGKKSSIELVIFENSYDKDTMQNVFQSIKSKLSTKS